jgi:hypothetical protein
MHCSHATACPVLKVLLPMLSPVSCDRGATFNVVICIGSPWVRVVFLYDCVSCSLSFAVADEGWLTIPYSSTAAIS